MLPPAHHRLLYDEVRTQTDLATKRRIPALRVGSAFTATADGDRRQSCAQSQRKTSRPRWSCLKSQDEEQTRSSRRESRFMTSP